MSASFWRFLEAKSNPSGGRRHDTFSQYPLTGGRARDGNILCRHGWTAERRKDETVYGCAGYVPTHLLRREGDDGLACGFYADAGRVPPLYINSLWDGRSHWGAYPPTRHELEKRRLYLTSPGSRLKDPAPAIIQRLRARGPPTLPPRSPNSPTKQRILAILRSLPPPPASQTVIVSNHNTQEDSGGSNLDEN